MKQETWTQEQARAYFNTGQVPRVPTLPTTPDGLDERTLQQQVERHLVEHGYIRMTAKNAELARAGHVHGLRGWYVHLNQPRGNCFLPDIVVFDMNGCVLLVELKRQNRYRPGQREMLEMGQWLECRTLQQFADTLAAWAERGTA